MGPGERLPLCSLPSPVHRADSLAEVLKVRSLWIKRDDLLGRGPGGNKLRKLERIAAAARAAGADALVTSGAASSNHACMTAVVARMLGWQPAVVLSGPEGPHRPGFNERLHERLGTEVRRITYVPGDRGSEVTARMRVGATVAELAASLAGRGHVPYTVPEGGACLEGTSAFVDAFDELHEAMSAEGMAAYDIVLAVGTGSTLAGLTCGVLRAGADVCIRGVSIAHPARRCRTEAARAARRVCEVLDMSAPAAEDFDISDAFVGAGYGEPTDASREAVSAALRCEGLLLDHTYTGKALGGLAGLCRDADPARPVVFWHTGGLPGAIDDLWSELPSMTSALAEPSFGPAALEDVADLVADADAAGAFLAARDDPGFTLAEYLQSREGREGFRLFALRDAAGEPVGFVTDEPARKRGSHDIAVSYVRREDRGRGLGRRLVAEIVERCRREGVATVHTRTWGANAASRRIFESLGFECLREVPDARIDGDSTVFYRLDLTGDKERIP